MGTSIHSYGPDEMDERFPCSGGSVREFMLTTPDEIRSAIDDAISGVEDTSSLLSSKFDASSGESQLDRLCHTFVGNVSEMVQFTTRRYWEQVIDSQYAISAFRVRLRSGALFQIYTWAKR